MEVTVFLPRILPTNSYSSLVKHSGFLYRNSLFSFSLRASHPQSTPVASLNQSTAALMPVAVVIVSMVSPKPLGFFVRFVGVLAVFLDSLSCIF